MMKQLIICERPFMLYKALLKAMNNTNNDMIDIVLSNHMPELGKMYHPLVESGIFHHVYFFDDDLYQDYIKDESITDYVKFPNILWAWPQKLKRYFRYQKEAKSKKMPEGLNLKSYDEILANDGVSTINFRLNEEKIKYVVSEHGRNNFRNKVPLHIAAVYISIILDRLNIIVAYSASGKYVKEVEVDRIDDQLVGYIRRKPLRECRINSLEESLNDEKREKIYQVYAKAYGLPMEFHQEVNILLTGPLFHDKLVESEEDQINCYRDAVAQNCESDIVLMVKPHPRDTVDYTKVFPNALIVDKVVTSEVLSLCTSLKINKVVTIYSTSISSFRKAKEMVVLGGAFLDNYHLTSKYVGKEVTPDDDLKKK